MKTIAKISVVIILTTAFILSCKKTKLDGDYEKLVGTWHWASGWSDDGSQDYKLDLKEKGKYKLFKGDKKVEYGRLIKDGDKLKFVSDNFIKKIAHRYLFLNGRKIYILPIDNTITIIEQPCCDYPSSTFLKN